MTTKEAQLARKIIRALANDWALVENWDVEAFDSYVWPYSMDEFKELANPKISLETENLILVNESRDVMKGRRPSRRFVTWLEEEGISKTLASR